MPRFINAELESESESDTELMTEWKSNSSSE